MKAGNVALPLHHGMRLLHHVVAGAQAGQVGGVDTLQRLAGAVQRAVVAHTRHPAELLQPLLAGVTAEFCDGTSPDVRAPAVFGHHLVGDVVASDGAHHVGVGDLDVLVLRPHLDGSQRPQELTDRRTNQTARERAAARSDHRFHPEGRIDDDAADLAQRTRRHDDTELLHDERDQHPAQRGTDQCGRDPGFEVVLDHTGQVMHDVVDVEALRVVSGVVHARIGVETERLEVRAVAQDTRKQIRHFVRHTSSPTLNERWVHPGGSTVLHSVYYSISLMK